MKKLESDFDEALLTAPMTGAEIDAIQAVEGIYLSPRMRKLFDQADTEGWRFEQRRTAILETLGITLD